MIINGKTAKFSRENKKNKIIMFIYGEFSSAKFIAKYFFLLFWFESKFWDLLLIYLTIE